MSLLLLLAGAGSPGPPPITAWADLQSRETNLADVSAGTEMGNDMGVSTDMADVKGGSRHV